MDVSKYVLENGIVPSGSLAPTEQEAAQFLYVLHTVRLKKLGGLPQRKRQRKCINRAKKTVTLTNNPLPAGSRVLLVKEEHIKKKKIWWTVEFDRREWKQLILAKILKKKQDIVQFYQPEYEASGVHQPEYNISTEM